MNHHSRTPDMSIYEAYLEARDVAEQLLQAHTLQYAGFSAYKGILVDFHRVETTLNRLTKMVNKLTARPIP